MTAARKNQSQKVGTWAGSASLLAAIPDGWHSTKEAAALVQRDPDTIRNWRRGDNPVYVPSGYMERGMLTVWLYSDEDIQNMRKIAATMKAGRPPKEHEEDE